MHLPTPVNLIVIMAVALLVFGPNKLPEIARALAKSMNEFKGALRDVTQHFDLEALTSETRIHPGNSVSSGENRSLAAAADVHNGVTGPYTEPGHYSYPSESSAYHAPLEHNPAENSYASPTGTTPMRDESIDQGINHSLIVG